VAASSGTAYASKIRENLSVASKRITMEQTHAGGSVLGCVSNNSAFNREKSQDGLTLDCRFSVVMGRDLVSALQPVAYCTIPDESESDRVSERDRLGLTPNLTTRDLWRSRRWTRK
jgi:hypothetical protein